MTPVQCRHGEMRKYCEDCSPAWRKKKETVRKRLQLEGVAAIMTGEYRQSLQLHKETKRYFFFIKGNVRIRIPKKVLNDRIDAITKGE